MKHLSMPSLAKIFLSGLLFLALSLTLVGCSSEEEPEPNAGKTAYEMPSTGYISSPFDKSYSDYPPTFTVHNQGSDAYVIKLIGNEGTYEFFVEGHDSFTIPSVVEDTYILRMACGDTWYGDADLFGELGAYCEDTSTYTFTEGDMWTVTVMGRSTDGGEEIHTESIPYESF